MCANLLRQLLRLSLCCYVLLAAQRTLADWTSPITTAGERVYAVPAGNVEFDYWDFFYFGDQALAAYPVQQAGINVGAASCGLRIAVLRPDGWLANPVGESPKVAFLIHGGGWIGIDRTNGLMEDPSVVDGKAPVTENVMNYEHWLNHGYLVIIPSYRGHGADDRACSTWPAAENGIWPTWRATTHDIQEAFYHAVKVLESAPFNVNPAHLKIDIEGNSAGGHLALLLAAHGLDQLVTVEQWVTVAAKGRQKMRKVYADAPPADFSAVDNIVECRNLHDNRQLMETGLPAPVVNPAEWPTAPSATINETMAWDGLQGFLEGFLQDTATTTLRCDEASPLYEERTGAAKDLRDDFFEYNSLGDFYEPGVSPPVSIIIGGGDGTVPPEMPISVCQKIAAKHGQDVQYQRSWPGHGRYTDVGLLNPYAIEEYRCGNAADRMLIVRGLGHIGGGYPHMLPPDPAALDLLSNRVNRPWESEGDYNNIPPVLDTDADGIANDSDADDDNDGVTDSQDVFPYNAAERFDSDSDGIGDEHDNCLGASNPYQQDHDGDRQGDVCDNDDDNDRVVDAADVAPFDESMAGDMDGDGYDGFSDLCPAIANADMLDSDGDGFGDACDPRLSVSDFMLDIFGFALGGTPGYAVLPGANTETARVVHHEFNNRLTFAYSKSSASHQFGLVRYNADGTVDTTFQQQGIAVSQGSGNVTGMVRTNDGRYVVAGRRYLARFNADGSVDTTFGTNGVLLTGLAGINALLRASDGSFYVAGWLLASPYNVSFFAIQKFNDNFQPVAGFGNASGVKLPRAGIATGIVERSNGQLVVAGHSGNSVHLVRLDATTGALDTLFGVNGMASVAIPGSVATTTTALQRYDDDSLAVAGYSNIGTASAQNHAVLLVRMSRDGVLNTGFGGDGIVVHDVGSGHDRANALQLWPDGSLLVAGSTATTTQGVDALLALFDSSGNFWGNVATSLGSGAATDQGWAILRQPDGKLVVAGDSAGDAAILRYAP